MGITKKVCIWVSYELKELTQQVNICVIRIWILMSIVSPSEAGCSNQRVLRHGARTVKYRGVVFHYDIWKTHSSLITRPKLLDLERKWCLILSIALIWNLQITIYFGDYRIFIWRRLIYNGQLQIQFLIQFFQGKKRGSIRRGAYFHKGRKK